MSIVCCARPTEIPKTEINIASKMNDDFAARLLLPAELVTVKADVPKTAAAVAGKTAPLLRACSSRPIQRCPWPINLRAFWMSSCGAPHFDDHF